jgi:glycosyltransferase involved in cell wall biosynthesis
MGGCMKIALVTDKFSTGGGLEHIFQVCLGMPDVEFFVFGKDGPAKEKFGDLKNVTVVTEGYSARAIKRCKPDLVHYHHLKPLLGWAVPAVKTLFTVHGVHLHKYEFRKGLVSRCLWFARMRLEKFLYHRIDTMITVSKDDAAYLTRFHKVRSITVFNGISFAPIDAIVMDKASLRLKLGLPQDKQIFLSVARFDFPKGYDILICAIAVLKKNGQIEGKAFVFAGDGEGQAEMRALAKTLGVLEDILFLGRRTDVYELLKATDVFVLPSRWEGLPITLIEALVARTPAIASNTYGISTVYREVNANIHLFENENIEELAALLAGEYQYQHCDLAMFTLQNMIHATRKVYFEN